MEQIAIFSATLGLSDSWQVTSASFAKDSNRLDISIEYAQGTPLSCPMCGSQETCSHEQSDPELWYHDDFFRYPTYLHVKVPLISCSCGGKFPLERPWSRAGSRFTRVVDTQ